MSSDREPVPENGVEDRIAAAVTACPGVGGLPEGPVATYLPGRTVPGVSLDSRRLRVAIRARYGCRLPDVADRVRAAVAPFAGGLPVQVDIEDVDIEDIVA